MATGGYADWEFVDQNTAAQLTLQPGVFFHNGEELTAERLKWFYERNLGIAEYNPDYVSGIRARIAFIDDLQVVDDLTLRVGMDPPSVNMPEQLGGGNTPVTPRDYIVEHGDEFFSPTRSASARIRSSPSRRTRRWSACAGTTGSSPTPPTKAAR